MLTNSHFHAGFLPQDYSLTVLVRVFITEPIPLMPICSTIPPKVMALPGNRQEALALHACVAVGIDKAGH